VLQALPSIAEQFHDAHRETPLYHNPRLAFRSGRVIGEHWIQLPSAAAFIDPLLSTGFPLTLLGLARFAKAIEEDWGTRRFSSKIAMIARENEADFLAAEQLVSALYSQMHDFPVFRALSLIYFAAASFSECARRLGFTHLDEGFLLHRSKRFNDVEKICARARTGLQDSERQQFLEEISKLIEPINVAGLARADFRHWYPADLHSLFQQAHKLGATNGEIADMIERVMPR